MLVTKDMITNMHTSDLYCIQRKPSVHIDISQIAGQAKKNLTQLQSRWFSYIASLR
jgi:hypothetical protein